MAVVILIVLLAALYLWAVFPAVRRHPDRKILEGRFIAHRGLHDCNNSAPENSMTAFLLAAELGFPIETDIHVTKDGEVVVFHDDTLKRMCGADVVIESLTLEELRRFRLSGTDEKIPTLTELLAAIDGRVPLLIEYKCTDRKTCRRLCEAAAPILGGYHGKYLVQSFYPFVLSWYRKNRPDICRGQLSSAFREDIFTHRLLGLLLTDFLARPDFISYECRYAKAFSLRFVSHIGAMPIGWTFRSQKELDERKPYFRAWIFETFMPDPESANNKKEKPV